MLIEQYNSQFSERSKISTIKDDEINVVEEGDMSDIEFSDEDIARAIDKLKKNSVAVPNSIPAILLINIRDSIKLLLQIILRKSMDE